MAIKLVSVRNKHTGEITQMSETALEYATDFEKTPQQKAAERDAENNAKGK